MLHYFDNKIKPKKQKGAFIEDANKRFTAEQYIWISFLKKQYDINCNDMYDIDGEKLKLS